MKVHIILVMLLILVAQQITAATLQTDPSVVRVGVGETFVVEVIGLDFPETQGGGFSLNYDNDILSVTNVAIDEAETWTFVNDLGAIDNERGELSEVQVSDFPGITGDFTVATVEFMALGFGTSRLELSESIGNPWASNGSEISPILLNDSLVQVVPIPAAVLLFGSGLLCLIGVNARKK